MLFEKFPQIIQHKTTIDLSIFKNLKWVGGIRNYLYNRWFENLTPTQQAQEIKDRKNSNGTVSGFKNIYNKVLLPEGLLVIDDKDSFKNMALNEIKLPQSLKKIGWGVFSENLIRNVEIPNSVIEISTYAFAFNPMEKVFFGPDAKPEIFKDSEYDGSPADLSFLTLSDYMTINLPFSFKRWNTLNNTNTERVFQTTAQRENLIKEEKTLAGVCFEYFDSSGNVNESNKIGCKDLSTQNKN